MPAPRPASRSLLAGFAALLAAAGLVALRPATADAAVTHLHGFAATVDGFTSWYGSYGMGPLGTAWCIDHGIRAPDPAFAYVPADLSGVPTTTQTAMAWVVGAHGQGDDPVAHAAVMLVLHDLMGAVYPSGPLDVDTLTPDRLAGFGGQDAAVIERARWLKADGLAHQDLRGPLQLTVAAPPLRDGSTSVMVGVHDADGRALAGISVHLDAPGAGLAATEGVTGTDGTWRTTARPTTLPVSIQAQTTLPRPTLDAWAPTTQPAQRVARPTLDVLTATTELAGPPPTTTTTTIPPTTTTTVAPTTTTTTAPPTTTTTTTIPSTTTTIPSTTTTTVAPTTTTTTAPPPTTTTIPPTTTTTVISAAPVASLPRTGIDTLALVLVAVGLVLIGSAAREAARTVLDGRPR